MSLDIKTAVISAFIDIAAHKSVDKITIRDLIERCNISRQTFYYHFKDMTDVMEKVIAMITQNALDKGLRAETPKESLQTFIDVATKNSRLFQKMLESQRREQIELMLVDALKTMIREIIRDKIPHTTISYADMETTLAFYSYGILGVLLEYYRESRADEAQLVQQLLQILSGSLLVTSS